MPGPLPELLHPCEPIGAEGAQADLLRVPLADDTLVATPDVPADDLIPSLLAASDVLGTGWFGAVAAQAVPGKTIAVVGDGAVGLLAVLAAKQLRAERIIVGAATSRDTSWPASTARPTSWRSVATTEWPTSPNSRTDSARARRGANAGPPAVAIPGSGL